MECNQLICTLVNAITLRMDMCILYKKAQFMQMFQKIMNFKDKYKGLINKTCSLISKTIGQNHFQKLLIYDLEFFFQSSLAFTSQIKKSIGLDF